MTRDLTREQLPSALAAWTYLLGGGGDSLRDGVVEALSWLATLWDAGDDHLPLTLVHDLGHLLARGREFRFASARDLARWPEDERAARMAYEDRVLSRWALDPSVLEAHVILAGTPRSARPRALAHAIGLALAPPLRAVPSLALGNPAHLRALGPAFADSLSTARSDQPDELPDPVWRDWARAQLDDALAALSLRGRLLRPEDLWELSHFDRLPSESARLALREVNTHAAAVGPVAPSVALRILRRAREVPVDAEEADRFPAGGFDAISTKGTFENLVRSEVAYVGEGGLEGGIDLFDLRFAEGELLYYTRDESPLLDARREVVFVFDRPSEQRFKLPSLPAQTLVLTQSLSVALQQDLARTLGSAGARVAFAWVAEDAADREAAEEERRLLSFLLASDVAHRRVELAVHASWSTVPEAGRVVWSPRESREDLQHLAWIRVGEARWTERDQPHDLRDEGAARALCDHLLLAIARGEPRRRPTGSSTKTPPRPARARR
jgi:hypothetical protein